MKIEQLPIKDIKPYERNAKKHDEIQIKNVMESIKQFGIAQPLVIDKDGVLIIGHCRLIACKRLKMKEVPVVKMDNLTQEEVDKLRLLDNKLNESEWDYDLLAEDIPALDFSDFDLDWGFKEEIEKAVKEEEGEEHFTEVLGEEHNYIVLYFDNEVDWLQLQSLIDVDEKMNLSTRRDGKINKGMKRKSIGRVFNGKEVLERLREHYENIN